MKLISLNCNHCGAPLEVPAKAKFVTCRFCESKLGVQRTESSWSTEVLEELQESTRSLHSKVDELQKRTDIAELDRAWENEKDQYLVRGKDGTSSVPSMFSGIAAILIGVVGGTVFFGFASNAGAPGFFLLFALVFALCGVGSGIYSIMKASEYENAQERYLRKRRELMNR